MPVRRDITIQRGATLPKKAWRLRNKDSPFDGTGSTFVLTIEADGVRTRWSTADPDSGLTFDNATGTLLWSRTVAESRLVGCGAQGRYEIERFIGQDQSPLIGGIVTGLGGINDD